MWAFTVGRVFMKSQCLVDNANAAWKKMIYIFSSQMTRLVLPGMVERYHHKHPDVTGSYEVMRIYDEFMDICLLRGIGLIVNMSSEVGVRPQPLLSLYCATKVLSHSDITSFMCLQTHPDRLPAYSLKQLHDTCFVTFFFSEFCNVLLSVSACRVQIKGNYCSGKVCDT